MGGVHLDSWKYEERENKLTGKIDFNENYTGKSQISDVAEVKYFGDMLHENGKPNSTVSSRIKRGYAIVAQILAHLNDIPLGNLRVEVGLALRQAWLINGMLFNCEVWNKTTAYQEEQLMSIDKYLLR